MKRISLLVLMALVILSASAHRGGTRTFYASECKVPLNSNVYDGGGTDATVALQVILNKAPKLGRLELVIDGAALISRPLTVYSNTTILCPDKSCGLFLADSSNCCLLTNANPDITVIQTHNVSIIGGVYNNNSSHQAHHIPKKSEFCYFAQEHWVYCMEFYGIEHLLMRDVTLANQRTFAFQIANWRYVTMENIHIDRRERADYQNQDGLHIFGPGRFLTMRNIWGNAGDDFIAIAPDEVDRQSSIEDVLIDGVHFEESDQGIRILNCAKGHVDRVIIRNVTGTYKSYGFYINPWFSSVNGGNFGNIFIDMVNMKPMKSTYNYTHPFLFKIGGHISGLTVKNVFHQDPEFNHRLFLVDDYCIGDRLANPTKIDRLVIDGVYIDEIYPEAIIPAYIDIYKDAHIGTLSVSNIIQRRKKSLPHTGALIRYYKNTVDSLLLNNISIQGIRKIEVLE